MMSLGTSEEVRFYLNLLKNTLWGPKYDLYKIPGPPGYRMAGNIPHLMRPDYHVQALEWANKYGGICRFSLGGQWIVLVSDPQLVAQLLGRGPNSLPRKCIGYSFFDMATNHLGLRSFFTTTDEEQWALIRKGTAQAFSQANIRRYFVYALKHAQELAEQVKLAASASKQGIVEVQEQVEMMLLDVFLEGLFEVDLRRVNSEEVGHAMNLVLEEANERIKMPLRKIFIGMFAPGWSYKVWSAQKVLGGLYERIFNTMRARGVPPAEETVLWACLARLRDPKTGKPLTKEQLLPEIGAFILAGFDTSSHTIAWCLFAIASHPEVQRRIKSELGSAGLLHQGQANCVTPRQLSFDDLGRLTYLNCVIDETMRMYPVAATGSVRESTEVTQIGPYKIPEGIVVWPMIYAVQNSVNNWEKPHLFKPERWLDKDVAYVEGTRVEGERGVRRFIPFSDGLKNCLGQSLGLMEVRTVLATLLARFWFELAPSMGKPEQVKKNQQIALTLKIKGGLKLICKAHSHDDKLDRAPAGDLN
eukprot:jgi/Chrzof1/7421/Cz02g23030.t1